MKLTTNTNSHKSPPSPTISCPARSRKSANTRKSMRKVMVIQFRGIILVLGITVVRERIIWMSPMGQVQYTNGSKRIKWLRRKRINRKDL